MNRTSATLLLWAPRSAGILVAVFLALFALDAFDGRPLVQTLPAFIIHLVPSLLVLAVVAASWKSEWIGAGAFLGLAVLYALIVRGRMDWIAIISGPLLIVAALFFVSRMRGAERHTAG